MCCMRVRACTRATHPHRLLPHVRKVDLDLGNYERFLNVNLTREHNITTGKVRAVVGRTLLRWHTLRRLTVRQVYHQVIKRERRGDYLGRTVQIIPHVTDAVQVCRRASPRLALRTRPMPTRSSPRPGMD